MVVVANFECNDVRNNDMCHLCFLSESQKQVLGKCFRSFPSFFCTRHGILSDFTPHIRVDILCPALPHIIFNSVCIGCIAKSQGPEVHFFGDFLGRLIFSIALVLSNSSTEPLKLYRKTSFYKYPL